ncbi:helix-turn-helix domain-containing protein [Paracidovorax anthurii]|uniref:helix-turn-helix domain-containing protein n=1 Tax=Paracidovorax anthurii TaxID=78229 RepID=UPI0011BDF467|nr:helix-turn-helix transcriptional regulator [Paracidovorax anthurii]
MNFTITPTRLIDLAKYKSGMELQEMAQELGYDKTRITKLKNGKCALTPTEVKYYADKAGLPFEQTICELELWKNPAAAKVWGVELSAANP